MKSGRLIFRSLCICIFFISCQDGFSQENVNNHFSVGSDFYTSYIYRGTKYGTGPVVQPVLKYSSDLFTAGGWGCFDFNGYQEADLFFLFTFRSGFSLGMTDYYYPNLDYFDFSKETGSHAYEINASFSKWGLTLNANYIINEAGGIGSSGGDSYFHAGYAFKYFDIFIGAGDGWHSTVAHEFHICNLGIGTSQSIKITDSFRIPVKGQIIFNPDREKMYIVVGFTL